MNRIFKSILYVALAIAVTGCAKHAASGPNDANKRYFDAWMELNHPDAEPSGLGIYIIEEKEGSGTMVEDNGYARLDYRIRNLEGTISSYTDKETAKQLGQYDTTTYYGPTFMTTYPGSMPAGVLNALEGMKTGGYRKVIIPSWLMNYSTFDSEEEYLDPDDDDYSASSYSTAIYELRVNDYTEDIQKWQENKIGEYFAANSDVFGNMTARDTVKGHSGFYYKQLKAPVDTTSFPSDTSIYINYTGKLLNGLIFDTTIERVAKDNGLYSADRSYEPVKISWGEDHSSITMGSGSSVVSGFSLTLWQMRAMEKGVGVFVSNYGYGGSGSGSSIPGFAPLIFEIEIVAKPED